MLSDPTYTQQINQLDRRTVWGGRYEKTFIKNDRFTWDAGVEGRYDDVGRVGLQFTDQRVLESDQGRYGVRESSLAPYTEATWSPIDKLRLMGGLRADYYSFDVHSKQVDYPSGDGNDHIVSPKAGAAYALNGNFELYANWGRGFHSNDARGVVAPLAGNDPTPALSTRQRQGARSCVSSKARSR